MSLPFDLILFMRLALSFMVKFRQRHHGCSCAKRPQVRNLMAPIEEKNDFLVCFVMQCPDTLKLGLKLLGINTIEKL